MAHILRMREPKLPSDSSDLSECSSHSTPGWPTISILGVPMTDPAAEMGLVQAGWREDKTEGRHRGHLAGLFT